MTSPHAPSPVDIDQSQGAQAAVVIDLLKQQCSLFSQLQGLSAQQSQYLTSGSVESLLEVLSQRQKVIDDLTTINTGLAPYRQQWAQFCARLNEPDRVCIGELVDQAQSILQVIIDRDDHDREQLDQAKCKLGTEMMQVAQSGAAMQAYKVSHGPHATCYTDRHG